MIAQTLPNLRALREAAREVYAVMAPTPQYSWPLVNVRAGREIWVKHENHTPVGAFKVRGGIVYFNRLRERGECGGVICATRGNHGQSVAFNARRTKIPATILVPKGNSREKNAAMRSLGAELIEYGDDFQDALIYARRIGAKRSLRFVPSYAPELVTGVASYALELFENAPPLDVVYAPMGLGSGLAGILAAASALELSTEVVAVVAEGAPAYALSLAARRAVEAPANTIADGMACRAPHPDALDLFIAANLRCITVGEDEIQSAMRLYFSATHNVAEGAGAASLAAAMKDKLSRGNRAGVILSGGNVDAGVFARVLSARP